MRYTNRENRLNDRAAKQQNKLKVSLSGKTLLRLIKSGHLVASDVEVEDLTTKQQLHDILLSCIQS